MAEAPASTDPFDSALFPEDRLHEEGFREGYQHGEKMGDAEGFATGYSRGAEVGSEVGFYLGFCETWLGVLEAEGKTDDRSVRVLKALLQRVKEFSICDVNSEDYTANLSLLKTKFKQVLALLKLSSSWEPSKSEQLSF